MPSDIGQKVEITRIFIRDISPNTIRNLSKIELESFL